MTSPPITAFPPRPSRVHEVCGHSAISFAAIVAAGLSGNILWIRERWRPEGMSPQGLGAFFDLSRLVLAEVVNQTETLAVAEEALRDGAVPLVIMDLSAALTLVTGRRLQLAAQAGRSTGLCLIPEGMGSPAAETRWRCTSLPEPEPHHKDSTLQEWELIKNKSGTLGAWHVRWDQSAHRLVVVSPARK